MVKKLKKAKTPAQKAAAKRNIKKAQEARDKAIISAAEKNLAKGKRANSLTATQKTVLGAFSAINAAGAVVTAGLAAPTGIASAGIMYGAMRTYNTRKIQESGQRTNNSKYNLKGTNPNRLTSKQLAWSYGLGGVSGMGVVRGYNAVTKKK
jgi:hypothetical protein